MFKSLRIYKIQEPVPDVLAFPDLLEKRRFAPLSPGERQTLGWMPVHEGALSFSAQESVFLAASKEEKILPAQVVREEVKKRALDIEAKSGRPLSKKDKESLKEEVEKDLLPRAFSRLETSRAWIDQEKPWIVIEAGSEARAAWLLELMRDTLGGFSVAPLVSEPQSQLLTHWLATEELPEEFSLKEGCELRDPQEKGVLVRIENLDPRREEVQAHLEAGKVVKRLSLAFSDRLSFALAEDLSFSKVTPLLQETEKEKEGWVRDWLIFKSDMDAAARKILQAIS